MAGTGSNALSFPFPVLIMSRVGDDASSLKRSLKISLPGAENLALFDAFLVGLSSPSSSASTKANPLSSFLFDGPPFSFSSLSSLETGFLFADTSDALVQGVEGFLVSDSGGVDRGPS
jgi:hypothetical protein